MYTHVGLNITAPRGSPPPPPPRAPDVGGLCCAALLAQLHVCHSQVGAAQINGKAVAALVPAGQHVYI